MKRASLFVGLVTAAAVAPAVLASGGTIVKLDGKAVIERRNLKVQVAPSTPIYSGDTLEVADDGIAQLLLEDDSVFVVPGAARLRIDTFAVAKPGAGGKAVYTLVNGGIRTITGRVSKGGDDQYELRADEGTITVAGSAYMAIRCQGACARKHKAGLYVRGESGTITIANAAGKLNLRRGHTAYVANRDTLPAHVKTSPFDDPTISADFSLDAEFDTEVHPPRVEPELTPSPS